VASTGVFGVIVVAAALVAGAYAIWAISRRNTISADNVNDSADVTLARAEPVSV
jgi:PiT family inorganic phosphate transporter